MPIGVVGVDGELLSTKALGIVDSGCDFTTFPIEWAERLGIDVEADCLAQEGTTAGGSTPQYFYAPGVKVNFLGKRLLLGATFAPRCPHVLLGREDFFRYFDAVTFDQAKETCTLVGASNWTIASRAARANVRRHGIHAHTHASVEAVVARPGQLGTEDPR